MGVLDCQKLTNFIYSKYFTRYSRFRDDLISCGYMGFYKALQKYDDGRGVKFSTYASNSIINEMRFFLRKELKHYKDRVDDIDTVHEIVGQELSTPFAELEISLKAEDRDILKSLYDGYNMQEIAKMQGISKQAVSKKIKRIKQKHEVLQEEDYFLE